MCERNGKYDRNQINYAALFSLLLLLLLLLHSNYATLCSINSPLIA